MFFSPINSKSYRKRGAAPAPPVRRFRRFLASPEARKILEETGNEPLPLPPLAP